ncbi:MAG: NADH-quinone oxidoreductase subunit A [Candidatus Omnitrophica bacterium]|nr:NADH-quinone oxidoreductase subunit A [Candidatus Omnitrophota bacterium]
MLLDYFWVFVFMIISLLFAGFATLIPYFIAPKSRGLTRGSTYESGMPTIGTAWIQFNVLYYLYALVFLVFDVEVVFLFPLALAFRKTEGFLVLIEIVIFIGILSLALVYAIRKGVFKWK